MNDNNKRYYSELGNYGEYDKKPVKFKYGRRTPQNPALLLHGFRNSIEEKNMGVRSTNTLPFSTKVASKLDIRRDIAQF